VNIETIRGCLKSSTRLGRPASELYKIAEEEADARPGADIMKPLIHIVALALAVMTLTPTAYGQRAIYLVRHAEKNGDDLTEAGRAQARKLASLLKHSGITAVYTSQFRRTERTAAPLIRELKAQGVSVHQRRLPLPDDLLRNPGDETLLSKYGTQVEETLRAESADDIVLLVGHDTTVLPIIRAYGTSAPIEKIEPNEFDRLFLIVPRCGPGVRSPGFFQIPHYAN